MQQNGGSILKSANEMKAVEIKDENLSMRWINS